jgi:hypothetical protein
LKNFDLVGVPVADGVVVGGTLLAVFATLLSTVDLFATLLDRTLSVANIASASSNS